MPFSLPKGQYLFEIFTTVRIVNRFQTKAEQSFM